MTIELRVGGRYRTRDGEVVGPLRACSDQAYPFADGKGRTWQADGCYVHSKAASPNDIVAEIDPPSGSAPDRLASISTELERIAAALTALRQQIDAIRKETQP